MEFRTKMAALDIFMLPFSALIKVSAVFAKNICQFPVWLIGVSTCAKHSHKTGMIGDVMYWHSGQLCNEIKIYFFLHIFISIWNKIKYNHKESDDVRWCQILILFLFHS